MVLPDWDCIPYSWQAVVIATGPEAIGIPYKSCWYKMCQVRLPSSSFSRCCQGASRMPEHRRRSSCRHMATCMVAQRFHFGQHNQRLFALCQIAQWSPGSIWVSWPASCRCSGIGALEARQSQRTSSWWLSSGTSSSSFVTPGYWHGYSAQEYLCRWCWAERKPLKPACFRIHLCQKQLELPQQPRYQ